MIFGSFAQDIIVYKSGCLHFWDKSNGNNTLVIATHGFIKKVDKVPTNEIDRASRIRAKYFENKLNK